MTVSLRQAPCELDELPPSCKLVYVTIREHDGCTQQDLADHTRLPTRTVRYALTRLDDHGLISSRPSVQDSRQTRYSTRQPGSSA